MVELKNVKLRFSLPVNTKNKIMSVKHLFVVQKTHKMKANCLQLIVVFGVCHLKILCHPTKCLNKQDKNHLRKNIMNLFDNKIK